MFAFPDSGHLSLSPSLRSPTLRLPPSAMPVSPIFRHLNATSLRLSKWHTLSLRFPYDHGNLFPANSQTGDLSASFTGCLRKVRVVAKSSLHWAFVSLAMLKQPFLLSFGYSFPRSPYVFARCVSGCATTFPLWWIINCIYLADYL